MRRARSNPVAVPTGVWWAALILAVLLAAYLRFDGLGTRSLWLDEFATWRVSRMPVAESLVWGPELTKPPLYQLVLRVLTREPRPDEFLLRLPAAVCGVLVVAAVGWIGRALGGWPVACAAALLLACNELQIDTSQQARSYSMLMLGCTVSLGLWYRLVRDPRLVRMVLYVAVTSATFHAHYLTSLTILAEGGWWLVLCLCRRAFRHWGPWLALVAVTGLCLPMTLHYLRHQTSLFQGLEWIPAPTWSRALETLNRLTFGPVWGIGILGGASALWLTEWLARKRGRFVLRDKEVCRGPSDPCLLLLIELGAAWIGLLVISWLAQPAMVDRYALPAALPGLLIPLIVANRLNRHAPIVLALVFATVNAPGCWTRGKQVKPGFRELSMFLAEHVEEQKHTAALVVDGTVDEGWKEMERLGFRYYPPDSLGIHEIEAGSGAMPPVLRDPRGIFLVVFRADPSELILETGRRVVPIRIAGKSYAMLLFDQYRLLYVAPLDGATTESFRARGGD